MRVFVTGAAGHLGRVLLPALLADSGIDAVIAHDHRPVPLRHRRLTVLTGDIRDSHWIRQAAGCDVVVHLAFVVIEGHLGRRRRDRALAHAINIQGVTNAVAACREEGGRLVHLSSASVYGPSPRPAREEDPLHPCARFHYAQDKRESEMLITEAERCGLHAIRLRPHIILGPQAQPFLRGLLRAPFFPRLRPAPLLQIVHESDVVGAILLSLHAPLAGAINLATADASSFEAMQRSMHKHPIPVPPSLARQALRLAFYGFGAGPHPGWTESLAEPLVLDTHKARQELLWRPRHPTVQSVLAALDSR